jgi:hypothetical protein
MKDRRVQQAFSRYGYQWGEGGHKKGVMRVTMVDVFLFIYENRRMNPVEIVLRIMEEEEGD